MSYRELIDHKVKKLQNEIDMMLKQHEAMDKETLLELSRKIDELIHLWKEIDQSIRRQWDNQ